MVTKFGHALLIAILLSNTTGCIRSQPKISHAHIGHALTAWHDTPGNQGLFTIAEMEAKNAIDELRAAQLNIDAPEIGMEHISNIVHSLHPEHQPTGTGQGYGVVPALRKAIQHIEFASLTDDASLNIVHSYNLYEQNATANLDQFLLSLAQARWINSGPTDSLGEQLVILEDLLEHAVFGKDLDKDGITGNLPQEIGLSQLRSQLDDITNNEVSPRYQPVPKLYLLGLVRLPDGGWEYRLPGSNSTQNEYGNNYATRE